MTNPSSFQLIVVLVKLKGYVITYFRPALFLKGPLYFFFVGLLPTIEVISVECHV